MSNTGPTKCLTPSSACLAVRCSRRSLAGNMVPRPAASAMTSTALCNSIAAYQPVVSTRHVPRPLKSRSITESRVGGSHRRCSGSHKQGPSLICSNCPSHRRWHPPPDHSSYACEKHIEDGGTTTGKQSVSVITSNSCRPDGASQMATVPPYNLAASAIFCRSVEVNLNVFSAVGCFLPLLVFTCVPSLMRPTSASRLCKSMIGIMLPPILSKRVEQFLANISLANPV